MTEDLALCRKWTLRAHGQQIVVVKKPVESSQHVLMKAFLWALYLPQFPQVGIEIGLGVRYRPDVVARCPDGKVLFWGEAGHVGADKLRSLVRRYRSTHFALARWDTSLKTVCSMVEDALHGLRREAPFDILCFPRDAGDRFINGDSEVIVGFDDVPWQRL
ncbi:MAG TPA: hypothetical protein VGO93_21900 [Candidatus Xenobia bacterium]|jgi:hypothetical protein